MPRFFDINSLTQEQKDNWDKAVIQYNKIQEKNNLNDFKSLTDKDKAQIKQNTSAKTDEDIKSIFSHLYQSGSGDEKSALFYRLLNNQKPLKFAPPLSYSYPWYEVVENRGPMEVSLFEETDKVEDMIKNNHIFIHQSQWEVFKILSKSEALITHRNWKSIGLIWKLSNKELNCKHTNSFIVAHHNNALERITTLEELEKEQLHHVLLRFNNINLAQDEELFQREKEKSIQKLGVGFGSAILDNLRLSGQELIQRRLEQGLSVYPSSDEIQKEVQDNVQNYLDRDITVKDGDLYQKTWVLERFDNNNDIYDDEV